MSSLDELYRQVAACQKCEIAKRRTRAVPGEGAEDADIMFIGEAPGWNEDQQGRPFVGQAGQFLDHLLGTIGLNRKQVYIANVIKCRPPDNRDPLPTEIQNCRPYLERQIELIKPKIIVTLGRFSLAMFFPGRTISKIHGMAQQRDGVIYYPMYHPAAALHQGSLRQFIEADMLKIPGLLAGLTEAAPMEDEDTEPPPQQLSLF